MFKQLWWKRWPSSNKRNHGLNLWLITWENIYRANMIHEGFRNQNPWSLRDAWSITWDWLCSTWPLFCAMETFPAKVVSQRVLCKDLRFAWFQSTNVLDERTETRKYNVVQTNHAALCMKDLDYCEYTTSC